MGKSRRYAVKRALEKAGPDGVVVWIEPEKHPFVDSIEKVAKPIREGKADLVIAERKSLESYPPIQQLCEKLGNHFFAMYTGLQADVWFGPHAMNRKYAEVFLAYNGHYGDRWDAIYTPIMRAITGGLRIEKVAVDYIHPAEQTQTETGNKDMDEKRFLQLTTLVEMIRQETEKLGFPKSKTTS